MIPKQILDKARIDMQDVADIAAMTGVSYFKGAFRKKGFVQMVNQAIYPHLARTLNKLFARKMLIVNVALSFVIALSVFVLAPYAVYYFSKGELEASVFLTRILCVWLFFGGIVVYLGGPVLVSFGYPKPFNDSVILGTLILLISYPRI